jgi:phenylpropionate dioxygenase-like ring-hydroxylating dioxygenase large terminal subunit
VEPLDLDELIRPDRVHRRLYTDPAIFEREMLHVFGPTWCYVAHASQLASPHDFVRASVGRRSVIVVRDDDGVVHGLLNRCTHRGTTLVVEERGCAKRFTCPYHGWSFACDGRLVALPFPGDHPRASGAGRAGLGLGRLAVAEHRGFLFATLHPDPPPLLEWLGHAAAWLDAHVDRHPGGELVVAPTPVRLEYAGNWKLAWDNAADGLHATFAHRSYNGLGRTAATDTVLARDPGTTEMVAKALGGGHMVVDQRPGIPAGPWATMRPMPFSEALVAALVARSTDSAADATALLDLATGSMVNLSVFPSLILVGNQLMVVEPLAVDRTRLSLHLVFAGGAPAAVNLLRLRVDEDFVSFGTPDDLEMFERVQQGLAIPEMEWLDVSRGLGSPRDHLDPDGNATGPISSEAPQRGYLAEYRRLLSTAGATRAR